jgi:hypothetical protein
MRPNVLWLALILMGTGLSAGCSDGGSSPAHPDAGPGPMVRLSGVAFDFGAPLTPLTRAEIGAAEFPALSTVTDASGLYALDVPDGADVTLFIRAGGSFPEMHLQTLHTAGEDLTDVNFQTISELFYDIFAGIIGIDPDPERCQIATTVNVAAVKGLSLEDFVHYGAHGIPGATVSIEPAVDPALGPVYFDASTIPDWTLPETTTDGGVVFANLPPGVYTLTAQHPTREIAPLVVTCEPGRFINAGPPWGLHEVAPP